MTAPRYLILLLLVILSSCLAETLSSGEEVSAYVTRMIEENEVIYIWHVLGDQKFSSDRR
jgi:DNA-binding phage protein